MRQYGALCAFLLLQYFRVAARADILYVENYNAGTICEVTSQGAVSTFASGLYQPEGIAFDAAGNLFYASQSGGYVGKITPEGVVSVFATGLISSTRSGLGDIAFDSSGNLYVATQNDHSVLKITPEAVVTTFASGMESPQGLAFDSHDDLFVVDHEANNVYEVTPDGTRSTFATGFNGPVDATFDSAGNFYVSNSLGRNVIEITTTGTRSVFASPGNSNGIAFDSAGNLFDAQADPFFFGFTVAEITPAGVVSTYATTGLQPIYLAVQVPEPASLFLLSAGTSSLLTRRRRSRGG